MTSRLISSVTCMLIGVAGLAAIGGCATPAPPPINVEQRDWTSPDGITGVQLLTDHYDLRLTARDPVLPDYLPTFMEAAFTEYARLLPPAREGQDRLVVYLFDSRIEWANFTRASFPPARARTYLHIHAGGYVDQRTGTAVVHDLRQRNSTFALLAHEGFHQYLGRYFPKRVPAWLNEGLATQWEGFEMQGRRATFTPRRNYLRRNDLRAALGREGEFIPITDLLRMHAGEAVVETGQTVRTYYAQVWSTVLFLRQGADGKYAEPFAKLLADAGTERLAHAVRGYRAATPDMAKLSNGEIIFRHYITDDLTGFMDEYRAFAARLVQWAEPHRQTVP